jgi:hypothetical protein
MSRFRPKLLEIRGFPTGSDPHPKGLRKKTGRTSLLVDRTNVPGCFRRQAPQFVPPETCAGPCEPSRRFVAWGPPRLSVTGLTARTPASLKGHLTRRIDAYLVSSWLTNAIDRIVKERPLAQTGGSARNALATALDPKRYCLAPSTDTIGRCESALEQLAPAVVWL